MITYPGGFRVCERQISKETEESGESTTHLRAEDDSEISLALVANRIGRTADIDLIRVGPSLIRSTIPREADLAFASAIGGPGPNSNVTITALHDGEVVRGAFLTCVG